MSNSIPNAKPGDLVLCRQNTVLDKIISVSQRLRTSSKASHWTHVAVVKDPSTGELYEAVGSGVRIGNISAYPDHLVANLNLSEDDQAKAKAFCEHWLGADYGFFTLASIGLDLLTPYFLHFRAGNTFICSQYAAKALEQTGWICPKADSSHVMPSDLAHWLLSEVVKVRNRNIDVIIDLIDEGLSEGETNDNECNTDPSSSSCNRDDDRSFQADTNGGGSQGCNCGGCTCRSNNSGSPGME